MPKKPQVCLRLSRTGRAVALASMVSKALYGVDTLTILVGPDESRHTVHKDLLCQKSPYFSAAANDCWKEGQEGRVPLPADDPSAFALYVQWLYRDRIFSSQDMTDTGGNREEIDLLVEALVLGEKLQDQNFKDAVIDSLVHAVDKPDGQDTRWYPRSAAADRAYRGTPEGSPLRKLLVDMHFFHGRADWLDTATNTDSLKDLAKEFLQDREGFVTRTDLTRAQLAGCSYHSHGTENSCHNRAP